MTSPYTLIDSTPHRYHGWKRHGGFGFAQGDAVVPLLLAELAHAVGHYPLAFLALPEGGYQLVALLGLHSGMNLFVDPNGNWQAPYIPSQYRAYPFAFLQVRQDDKTTFMLGFDQSSGLYREAPDPQQQEERFFNDEGQPLPSTQQMVAFLGESLKNRIVTHKAVVALAAAHLMEPYVFPFKNPDGAPPLLTNLYRINPSALQSLPGAVLEILRDTQAFDIAYAQMYSLPRLAVLRSLTALRATRTALTPPLPTSLDSLFGESTNAETVNFDWLEKPNI